MTLDARAALESASWGLDGATQEALNRAAGV
jgi:hypothetical protein